MKPLDCFQKRSLITLFAIFMVLCVIAVGTQAWLSLVQNFTNEFIFEPYDVRLVKLDKDTDMPLYGASFELYNESEKLIGRYVTDMNGEIVLSNLDNDKNYYFKEVKAPYGYEIDLLNNITELFGCVLELLLLVF